MYAIQLSIVGSKIPYFSTSLHVYTGETSSLNGIIPNCAVRSVKHSQSYPTSTIYKTALENLQCKFSPNTSHHHDSPLQLTRAYLNTKLECGDPMIMGGYVRLYMSFCDNILSIHSHLRCLRPSLQPERRGSHKSGVCMMLMQFYWWLVVLWATRQ